MNRPLITITVVSDVVCPWCYIGKRRLEKALAAHESRYRFEVTYAPFELNPALPAEGVDQKAYLTRKFGSEARYQQITRHVREVAAAEGLQFDFERQRVSPNTRTSHRLLLAARESGHQPALKEALMKAYFEEGVNLSRTDELTRIALAVGMAPAVVEEVLTTRKWEREVEQAEEWALQRGVTGVPFFIIQDQYGLSGAQPPEVFAQVFEEAAPVAAAAGSCDPDSGYC